MCCSGDPAPRRPHIVLIVIDTLRADHLGAYGYGRPTSPHIDRLAQQGVVFTRARATSSWTKPSVASLFTSRRPSEHGAVTFARGLRAGLPTLAELLGESGYRTMGISGNFANVNSRTGLSRGFDIWETIALEPDDISDDTILVLRTERRGDRGVALRAPTAGEVNGVVLDHLPSADGPPLFLYVHYMDPHAGYMPPAPHRAAFLADGDEGTGVSSDAVVNLAKRSARLSPRELRRMTAFYDGEIATVDAAIGSLLTALEQRGFGNDVVTVVLSDHGEEFGEHGGWFHGLTLHREVLSVPLVIHDSRRSTRSLRADLVDLLDVPTTLLALAGVATSPGMRGRDLLGPGPLPARDIVAELHPDPLFEGHLHPRSQWLSVTRWPWKVIVGRDGEEQLLYRLDRDPLENEPLAQTGGGAAKALLQAAAELIRKRSPGEAGSSVDPDTLEELRTLGYAD